MADHNNENGAGSPEGAEKASVSPDDADPAQTTPEIVTPENGGRARPAPERRDIAGSGVRRALTEFDTLKRVEQSWGIGSGRLDEILKISGGSALALKNTNAAIAAAGGLDAIASRARFANEMLGAAGGLGAIARRHEEMQRSVAMLGGFDQIFGRHSAMQKAIDAAGGLSSLSRQFSAVESIIGGGVLASLRAQSPAEKAIWEATRQNDLAMRRIAGVTAFTGLLGRSDLTSDSVGSLIAHTLEWQKATGSISLSARLQRSLPELFPTLRRAQQSDFTHLALPSFAERFIRDGDRLAQLRDEMLRVRRPWVDADDPVRSVAGYIEAKALASVVTSAPAESRAVVAAVRAELGDYRDSDPVPDMVAGDPILRSAFRLDLGFNGDLSSLPPAIISRIFADFGGPVPRNVEADPEALENAVHQRARRAELKLRRFIEARMQAIYGPRWWKERVPEDARKEWRRRRQVDIDNGRKPSRFFDYAGFEDYRMIIENPANWAEVFEPVFHVKTSILETLRRLSLIRNPDAHIRVVTIDDFLDLWTEGRRLDQWLDAPS